MQNTARPFSFCYFFEPGCCPVMDQGSSRRKHAEKVLEKLLPLEPFMISAPSPAYNQDHSANRIEIIDAAFFSSEFRINPARSQA